MISNFFKPRKLKERIVKNRIRREIANNFLNNYIKHKLRIIITYFDDNVSHISIVKPNEIDKFNVLLYEIDNALKISNDTIYLCDKTIKFEIID